MCLVGNHGHRDALGLEIIQALDHAGEAAHIAAVLAGVMMADAGQCISRRRQRVVDLDRAGQRAFDEIRNAPPDIAADRIDFGLRPPHVAQHGAGRGVQIGDGVEQRAVEIEDDGTDGKQLEMFSHGFYLQTLDNSARMAAMIES